MTTYKYQGISKDGANIGGVITAYDEYEAVSKLRESCSIITKIEPVRDLGDHDIVGKIKIPDKELAIMCSQFAIILTAGLPVINSVRMVAEQTSDKHVREKLYKVADDIAAGYSMAQSFETNLPDMPTTFIETIRAGEQAGTLEECFRRLHNYYDKSSKVRAKVIGALTYPAIVIAVAIVVIVIIMTVAVPIFTQTFVELGSELPGVTKALIAVSDFFVSGWWIMLLIVAIAAVGILLFRKTETGKRAIAEFMLMKSPVAKIKSMGCASDFASTMSTMIAAGLPIIRALEITSSVVDNYVFSLAIVNTKEDIEQGRSLADSMRDQECFPMLLTEMCGVGERTGAMEQTLDVISDFYSNEVSLATDKLLAAMEPAITIGLAVITTFLLLAVYLPMFSLYGSIGV